jgi:hypothetical protein
MMKSPKSNKMKRSSKKLSRSTRKAALKKAMLDNDKNLKKKAKTITPKGGSPVGEIAPSLDFWKEASEVASVVMTKVEAAKAMTTEVYKTARKAAEDKHAEIR